MHGYELKNLADKLLAGTYSVSYGSLYPKFKMLEQQGYITSKASMSEGGQQKIYYSITHQGRGYFLQLMNASQNESFHLAWVRFKLKSLFFKHLEYEQILPIITDFRKLLKNELSLIEEAINDSSGMLDHYSRSSLLNSYDLLKLKIQWLNALLK